MILKFNMDNLYDPTVTQLWGSYPSDRTEDTLSDPVENALISDPTRVMDYIRKGRYKIWLTTALWECQQTPGDSAMNEAFATPRMLRAF